MAKFLPLTRAVGLAVILGLLGIAAPALTASTGTGQVAAADWAGLQKPGANSQMWPSLRKPGSRQVADAATAGQAYTGLRSPSARPTAAPDPAIAKVLDQGAEAPKGDANVYITPQHLPKDDLLQAYSANKAAKAQGVKVPGLLGIASQAYRSQKLRPGQTVVGKPYSLADAMRDAMWRKKTAAMLRNLTR